MKHSLVTLLVTFLASASVTGFAANTGDLIGGTFDATSKKERLEIAREILGDIEKLSNYVATSKPADITWILTEQEAIDQLKGTPAWSARIIQLHETPEFQNLKLRNLLDNIEHMLQCVIGVDVIWSIEREIFCWSVISRDLSDRSTIDNAIPILIKHDRLPKDIEDKAGLSVITNYSDFYDWYGTGIHAHIVIPYLQGKITE